MFPTQPFRPIPATPACAVTGAQYGRRLERKKRHVLVEKRMTCLTDCWVLDGKNEVMNILINYILNAVAVREEEKKVP